MATKKYIPEKSQNRVVLERSKLRDSMHSPDSIEGGTDIGSGLLTAFQSLALTLLCVVIPVISTTAISTTLLDQDFDAGRSLLFAVSTWSLAHGGSFSISGATISLVPIGLTMLFLWISRMSVRRSLRPTLVAIATYVTTYSLVLLIVTFFLDAAVPIFLRTLIVSSAMLLLSVHSAFKKRPDARYLRDSASKYIDSLPSWLLSSFLATKFAFAAALVVGIMASIGWLFLGSDNMALVLDGWTLDALSNLAFVFAQVLYLPNLLLWALNWLSGTGFTVGVGTIISPSEVVLGPLPSVPLLGALPQSVAPPGFVFVFCALVVVAGIVAGWRVAKRDATYRWWSFVAVPAVSAALLFALYCLVNWCNFGEIGGGADYVFGPRIVLSSVMTSTLLAGGIAIGFCTTRREPRTRIRNMMSTVSDTKYTIPNERSESSVESDKHSDQNPPASPE